jgi:hypothetical protein
MSRNPLNEQPDERSIDAAEIAIAAEMEASETERLEQALLNANVPRELIPDLLEELDETIEVMAMLRAGEAFRRLIFRVLGRSHEGLALIRRLLGDGGVSQAADAAVVGVSQSTMSRAQKVVLDIPLNDWVESQVEAPGGTQRSNEAKP